MSTLALSPPGAEAAAGRRPADGHEGATRGNPDPAPALFQHLGGEPTLDELLAGVWEGLAAHRAQTCPVCGGEMEPAYGAHARPLGGRCTSCGSKLA